MPHRPDLSWFFAHYFKKFPSDHEVADILLSALRSDPTYDASAANYIDAVDVCEPATGTKEYRRVIHRSRTGGNEWEPLTKGLPQRDCYVNVLRDAMAVDSLDPCGIYFGTTGGQVYGSADGGESWNPIVRDLPAVLSVEVQVLS